MNIEKVTVAVLCYNASSTVVQTLDSIKNQSFSNIELLINDDCSIDNSVDVIKEWISHNSKRFDKVSLFTHDVNKGISYSFDFIVRQASNKWVKCIASDDILMKDCIKESVAYVLNNDINTLLYTSMIPFKNENDILQMFELDKYEIYYIEKLCKKNAYKQYKSLLKRDINLSPTLFMNADLYKQLGGIDLRIRNIEDHPLRLLFTSNGYKLFFYNIDTVLYRISDSVSRDLSHMYNAKHINQLYLLKKYMIYPNIPIWHIFYYFSEYIEKTRYHLIINKLDNNINFKTIFINTFFKLMEINKLCERLHRFYYKLLKEK